MEEVDQRTIRRHRKIKNTNLRSLNSRQQVIKQGLTEVSDSTEKTLSQPSQQETPAAGLTIEQQMKKVLLKSLELESSKLTAEPARQGGKPEIVDIHKIKLDMNGFDGERHCLPRFPIVIYRVSTQKFLSEVLESFRTQANNKLMAAYRMKQTGDMERQDMNVSANVKKVRQHSVLVQGIADEIEQDKWLQVAIRRFITYEFWIFMDETFFPQASVKITELQYSKL